MKNSKSLSGLLLAGLVMLSLGLSSCSEGARINGVLTGGPEKDIVVKLLDVNKFVVLDTVRTDSYGRFDYKVELTDGCPEFIYLFYGDRKVASLLLMEGDKVNVSADTLGTYSVSGSAETEKLIEVERNQSEFLNELASLSAKLDDIDEASPFAAEVKQQIVRAYVGYYRNCVAYVMKNSRSLTSIPVLYQTVNETLPVFGQSTDAIHFRNVCDSLSEIYPKSKYVAALAEEAKRRQDMLALDHKLQMATQAGYMDMEMPDIKGNKVKLSGSLSKVTMLYFWDSAAALQKMYNLDIIKPVYEEMHSKGFEVYAVSLDTDKAVWAGTVKSQQLPWINVCDGRGSASTSVALYNVTSLPLAFFIVDGNLVQAPELKDAGDLRAFIGRYVK